MLEDEISADMGAVLAVEVIQHGAAREAALPAAHRCDRLDFLAPIALALNGLIKLAT